MTEPELKQGDLFGIDEVPEQPAENVVRPRYLIDANCLIRPYNDYYRPTFKFSKRFWNALEQLITDHTIGILNLVWKEAYKGEIATDELRKWLRKIRRYTFEAAANAETLEHYRFINGILADSRIFVSVNQTGWMEESVADPWLIAAAQTYQSTVVTFEKPMPKDAPKPWRKAKIPSIAERVGVSCIDLFQFMEETALF